MPKDDNPSDVAAERVNFDYPPLGGVTVACQLVGACVRMYVPRAELRQLLVAASRMSTRLGPVCCRGFDTLQMNSQW
ncbi:MAG TPA: hypothetical protein VG055_32940 [Planctomycetaceae bacterium]|jgi:hypothetical protein|nr:hypothetical protein [Planctomycetaceae bacterium]